MSNGTPVTPAPLSARLTIPLQQHIGAPAEPLVEVGDRVLKGQMIAKPRGYVSAAVHASSSGTVIAIEKLPVPHPSGLSAPCIVIETDGAEEWAKLPEPLTDFTELEPSPIRERIRWAGVVGLGGAAFPANVKLNPGSNQPIHTLIINGAECEPYITCDDMLMRERAGAIIQGASVIHHMIGAQECLIGIEDNKPDAIESMRLAVAESDIKDWTQVATIPTIYPSGGERQLIRVLTGREVPSNGMPAQIGVLCQNVGTAAAVADAVLEGKPLISRYVTLSGRGIGEPRNLDVPIGTPVSDLIEHCGGLKGNARKLVFGGPMMGFTLEPDEVPITKGANCLLALTPEEAPDPGPALPCIRCGRCAEACPANLLPQQLYWYARAKDLDKVQDYNLFDCIECGCCSQVCPSHIPLVQYYRFAKTESWAREREKRKAERARERHQARLARLERLERERKAQLRRKKDALAKKPGTEKVVPEAAQDPRKAMIEAARKRAAARKAALAEQGVGPRNTDNLTPAQQRQINDAETRRRAAQSPNRETAREE